MENKQGMNWQSLIETLKSFPEFDLQFQYEEGKWVDASYHITEIKQAPITSVDCGGVKNSWTEIIIQLWEPKGERQLRSMKVKKALSIIELVEKTLPLNPDAVVKIEFGNSEFDTRQMYPGNITSDTENLIIDLRPDVTQCKAIERGGSCGTTPEGEECCTTEKPKIKLINLAESNKSCAPGSGCC